jgi:hypothetical protein
VGLRNPWRYSFDRQTGDLWVADVGQNQIEEINVVPAGSPGGLNFGWPIIEGQRCFQQENCDQTGLVIPIIDYPHQGDCSVTGGYVYRGQQIPAWNGVYFYGDYCSGKIWALAPDGQGGWNNALLTQERIQLSISHSDQATLPGEIRMGMGNRHRCISRQSVDALIAVRRQTSAGRPSLRTAP